MKSILSKFCNTYFLIFSIMLAVAALTWLVPAGQYDRVEKDGRTYAVAGSFHTVDAAPQGIGQALQAPIKGFAQCAEIIAFILVVGALFTVIERTGAVNTLIKKVSFFFARHPKYRVFFTCLHVFVFAVRGGVRHGRRNADFYPHFYPAGAVFGL